MSVLSQALGNASHCHKLEFTVRSTEELNTVMKELKACDGGTSLISTGTRLFEIFGEYIQKWATAVLKKKNWFDGGFALIMPGCLYTNVKIRILASSDVNKLFVWVITSLKPEQTAVGSTPAYYAATQHWLPAFKLCCSTAAPVSPSASWS